MNATKAAIGSEDYLGSSHAMRCAGNADHEKAAHWYRLSSRGDCHQAQLRLAKLYLHHKDVDQRADMISDRSWLPAFYYMAFAKLMPPRTTTRLNEARDLLERSAVRGDVEAQGLLAGFYLRGRFTPNEASQGRDKHPQSI